MLALEGKGGAGYICFCWRLFQKGLWRHVVMVCKFPTWFCRRRFQNSRVIACNTGRDKQDTWTKSQLSKATGKWSAINRKVTIFHNFSLFLSAEIEMQGSGKKSSWSQWVTGLLLFITELKNWNWQTFRIQLSFSVGRFTNNLKFNDIFLIFSVYIFW